MDWCQQFWCLRRVEISFKMKILWRLRSFFFYRSWKKFRTKNLKSFFFLLLLIRFNIHISWLKNEKWQNNCSVNCNAEFTFFSAFSRIYLSAHSQGEKWKCKIRYRVSWVNRFQNCNCWREKKLNHFGLEMVFMMDKMMILKMWKLVEIKKVNIEHLIDNAKEKKKMKIFFSSFAFLILLSTLFISYNKVTLITWKEEEKKSESWLEPGIIYLVTFHLLYIIIIFSTFSCN